MFSSRKKFKPPQKPSSHTISETVAGVSRQVDKLVAIVQDTNATASDRITAAEMIRSFVEFQNLSSISEIWYATQILIEPDNSHNIRRAGWRLTLSCIGKDELNNSSVIAYYTEIVTFANTEDFNLCLDCLKKLTNDGRRTIGTQAPESLSQFLLHWIELLAVKCQELRCDFRSSVYAPTMSADLEESFHGILKFTCNCLKFNMYMWEPVEIEVLMLQIIAIIRLTSDIEDCKLCFALIETVMAYGLVPAVVLQPLLEVICGLMSNIHSLRKWCRQLLIGFSSGHLRMSTYARLCRIVDTPNAEITLGMRCAAAAELIELVIKSDKTVQIERTESASSIASSRAASLISERTSPSPSALHNNNNENYPPTIDVSIPISDILDCFINTLNDRTTPPKLVVIILDGMILLTTKFQLLRRICAGPLLVPGLPSELINLLMDCYLRFEQSELIDKKKDSDILNQFESGVSILASAIAENIIKKQTAISPYEQLYACIRISRFLSNEACNSLYDAIQESQFCTPGIDGWQDRLREVIENLFVKHEGIVRTRILDGISSIYHLRVSDDDGFITEGELEKLTSQLFGVLSTTSLETARTLMSIYEEHVFYCTPSVFKLVTRLLVGHVLNTQDTNSQNQNDKWEVRKMTCNAICKAFVKAYRVHTNQAFTTWNALLEICSESVNNEQIFAPCYAVLCRARVDKRDRLMFVDQCTEPTYSSSILSMQEPTPPFLREVQSVSSLVLQFGSSSNNLQFSKILEIMLKALRESQNERVISLVLMNAASQLANYRLYELESPKLLEPLTLLRDQMLNLVHTGGNLLAKDISSSVRHQSLCIVVHILTVLMPYKPIFSKTEHDKLMGSLISAIGQYNLSTGWAVHCCIVACYEAPSSVQRFLPQILSRLQLKITSRDSSMFILDFLLSISLEGSLTDNFTEQDYKRVFGMCFSFIQNANDSLNSSNVKTKPEITAQWLLRLAHSAITNLFLSMNLASRRALVPYLVRCLILSDHNPDTVDPMSLVLYDMLNRFTYSDVPLRVHLDNKLMEGPEWETRRWMRGVVVVEIQVNKITGEAVRIIRRPAGMFTTEMRPARNDKQVLGDMISEGSEVDELGKFYTANYYLLCGQLGLATFQNMASKKPSGGVVPLSIPMDNQSNRAIQALDRVPVVDFYKVGIIYIAPGQRTEHEIMANTSGSQDYREFLDQIGVLIRLKNNRVFYAGGLDTEQDLDGPFAIAWSSKISQIIFHTITMMPTQLNDTAFASKKRHIGNNFVNIYFDESGLDFDFDVVKSQFNFINIVITPTNVKDGEKYWKVRAYRKEGMMNTLAAYETKVVSSKNLPLFVRNLCLKTSQYAAIHNLSGEYTDNWIYRLQLIQTLRARVSAAAPKQSPNEESDFIDSESSNANNANNANHQNQNNQSNQNQNQNQNNDQTREEKENIKLLDWMDFTRYTI